MMKSTVLLSIALFFAIAPSPDAKIMSEVTAGFLKADRTSILSGPEVNPAIQIDATKQQASFETKKDSPADKDS